MHPAPSIVVFTVLSGAGYGLLAMLGLAVLAGFAERAAGLLALGFGMVLAAAGLLASTFHLGHPERAWRAFSQWRSSWLSREGLAAVATFLPAVVLGWLWLVGDGPWPPWGLLLAIGSAVTVVCTAMIYASLKPIARWHSPWVPASYLGFAASTGLAWLWLALALTTRPPGLVPALVAVSSLVAWAVKLAYWRRTDDPAAPTANSATGLGPGQVRLVEPPHVGRNYILREMGFRVARKHAARLRRIGLVLGGLVPTLLGLLGLALGADIVLAPLAVLAAMTGTLVERWLFFAEARHTVMLFYGEQQA